MITKEEAVLENRNVTDTYSAAKKEDTIKHTTGIQPLQAESLLFFIVDRSIIPFRFIQGLFR